MGLRERERERVIERGREGEARGGGVAVVGGGVRWR